MSSASHVPPAPLANGLEGVGTPAQRTRICTLSTIGFTLMFAVWLMFGVLGIPIRKEFNLTEVQFGWLTAIAILNGSIWRLLFGIATDRFGGRRVLTCWSLLDHHRAAFLVSQASSFNELLFYAFLVGMAGNAFSVGIAWNSAWFPRQHAGLRARGLRRWQRRRLGHQVHRTVSDRDWCRRRVIRRVDSRRLALRAVSLRRAAGRCMAAAIWFVRPKQDHKPGAGRPMARNAAAAQPDARLAVQPLLRRRLRRLRRALGLAAEVLRRRLRDATCRGRAADGPVHLPGEPAAAARAAGSRTSSARGASCTGSSAP